jgi:hypothetical protein
MWSPGGRCNAAERIAECGDEEVGAVEEEDEEEEEEEEGRGEEEEEEVAEVVSVAAHVAGVDGEFARVATPKAT